MKRIVLTGGGTAGHVTPNLAILPLLRQEGWEVLYIGSENGIEKKLIEAEGVPYYSIPTENCAVICPDRTSPICSVW